MADIRELIQKVSLAKNKLELQNLKTLVGDQRRSTEYTRYQYPRFGRRSNYASQRYQYAY